MSYFFLLYSESIYARKIFVKTAHIRAFQHKSLLENAVKLRYVQGTQFRGRTRYTGPYGMWALLTNLT